MWLQRSFEPAKDQHPVSWLLESLTPEVYAPMSQWLSDLMEGNLMAVDSGTMPDAHMHAKSNVLHFLFGPFRAVICCYATHVVRREAIEAPSTYPSWPFCLGCQLTAYLC